MKLHDAVQDHACSALIVGGGPAGLATAMELARRGVAAVVVERGAYNDIRIGEHLSPAGILLLRALAPDSRLPLNVHSASAGVDAYWGSQTASHMDYFFHPGQNGLNLSRPRFDADLAHACEMAGATIIRCAHLKRALKQKRGWIVEIETEDSTALFPAAVIVDATGRSAAFSRRQGASIVAHDRQVSIIGVFDGAYAQPGTNRLIIEAVEGGWWYSALIGASRRICMLITDDDLLPRGGKVKLQMWWRDQLSRTSYLTNCLQEGAASANLIVRSARSQRLDVLSGAAWLAIGDAATAFDPLTSLGIAKALDHGKRAASAVAAYLGGEVSSLDDLAVEFSREYADYRGMRARYYRLEKRWSQSPFWERRHHEPCT